MSLFKGITIVVFSIFLFSQCRQAAQKETKRPNILFCIADDQSFMHTGTAGCKWVNTPAFDRVASQGIYFANAYTPNAKCAPSRACILTGRNSWQLKEASIHMAYWPQQFKTYAEVLGDHGYFVGATAKPWAPGDPGMINGKRRDLCGKKYDDIKLTPPTPQICDIDYAANFKQFMDEKPADKPFCFWYGSREPHRAYEYASGINKGGKDVQMIDDIPPMWPQDDTIRTDMLDYAFEVEHFNNQLQLMLDLLEERGELDNTLVVVTADNGMPFPRIKGQEYELSNHLPLAVMWKKGIKNPGRVETRFVNFIDYAPTFLDVANVNENKSGMQPVQGKSLRPIFEGQPGGYDYVLIGKERHDVGRPGDVGYPIRGIVQGDFLYIKNFKTDRWPAGDPVTGYLNCDGSPTKTEILNLRRKGENIDLWQYSFGKRPQEELYNHKTDPYCMHSLINNFDLQDTLTAMRQLMTEQLTAQKDPRILGHGDIFETYPIFDKKIEHFYERFMAGEPMISKAGWVEPSDFERSPVE